MNNRQKALLCDMVRVAFWGLVGTLLVVAWLSILQVGMVLLSEQPDIICSGSPEDCSQVTEYAP